MPLPLVAVPARGFVSFVNAPVVTDLASLEADVAILGVPYGIPYEMGQCRSFGAPGYIREMSMRFRGSASREACSALSDKPAIRPVRIVDCGDVTGDPMDIRGTVNRATEAVRMILSRGAVPIVLGGDDAIPIPVVRAYENHGPLVVVQIDQHFDFGDEVRGVREGYSSPIRRISEMPWVSRIVQIAIQGSCAAWMPQGDEPRQALVTDVDPQDATAQCILQAVLASRNIIITAREVHDQGVQAVLARIPKGASYFITMDFDGLDPSVCPAVSHPEPGGLTFCEASDLLRGLAAQGRIAGMDLTEMVPAHDLHGLGGHTAGRLILTLIGAMARSGQFARK
ncbi:MAG: arginase [Planctomycetes bacterium]|nr:arginase [Planctomycetota bacterium]